MRKLPAFAAAMCALSLCTLRAADPLPAALSARDLAARANAAIQGSASIRARLEVQSSEGKRVFQLQIKQRRTSTTTDLVYEVLWPKERKGEAVILRQSAGSAPTGSIVVAPNSVRPIKASQMDDGLLGSDLSYQDAVENFFVWGSQAITGTETVDGVECQILESKPGGSGSSIYGKVRSWIDPRRFIPMRVEKYSGSGQLVRRIDTTRVALDDKRRPTPASVTVRSPQKSSVTEFEGSRIDQDVTFTDRDFTPEGLAK